LLPFAAPAPELFDGIAQVRAHDATGHLTYLLGNVNTVGWPSFYVVALGVKMPIPLILLALSGLALMAWRGEGGARRWIPLSITLGVLVFASYFTQIKIGTRHVLPVFAAFAMAGGVAFSSLLQVLDRFRWTQRAAWLIPAWLLAGSFAAHPNYLAYFNAFAGDNPADVLVDSDLDWGQDVKRLAARLKEVGADEVYFNQFLPGDLAKVYGFPPIRPLDFEGPRPGWNAVQLTPLKLGLFGDARIEYPPDYRFWPETIEGAERIGPGILLFHQPPAQ
jgi:hypothetical protein